MITVTAGARSEVGVVRRMNEDSMLARTPAFLVADGMGGHARGDAASQTALRVLGRLLPPGEIPSCGDVLAAVQAANAAVRSLSAVGDSGSAVAGTTLTGVVQVRRHGEAQWLVLNVGDSRVYEWDGESLSQLTIDHSAVQELLDAGLITPAEALVHPERNVITRALGADDDVDVDVWLLPAAGEQTFLVCSDGLTKELDDEEIAAIVAEHAKHAEHAEHLGNQHEHGNDDEASGPASLADALVEAALDAGGRDNVSVIVVRSLAWEPAGQW